MWLVKFSIKSLFISGTSEAVFTAQVLSVFLSFKPPPESPLSSAYYVLGLAHSSKHHISSGNQLSFHRSQPTSLVSIFCINYFHLTVIIETASGREYLFWSRGSHFAILRKADMDHGCSPRMNQEAEKTGHNRDNGCNSIDLSLVNYFH